MKCLCFSNTEKALRTHSVLKRAQIILFHLLNPRLTELTVWLFLKTYDTYAFMAN